MRLRSELKKLSRPKFSRRFKADLPNFKDEILFLKGWLDQPRSVGAIAPTGKKVAALMASSINPNSTLPVLELGPGTGVITKAILQRDIDPSRLVCVEYSEEFCDLLRKRFPDIHVIQGDAYDLEQTLKQSGFSEFSTVISGLPLLNQKPIMRKKVVKEALALMQPGRPFVQFSYGFLPPLGKRLAGDIITTPSNWIMGNVPPARVWTFRRPMV